MSRQGGGRAPVGLGIGGGVVVLGLAVYGAVHVLRLRKLPHALSAPVALVETGPNATTAAPVPVTAPAEVKHLALPPDVLFARNSPAVVRINVHDGSMKPIGHGSGFFVSADGLAITNYHVIDGAHYATVQRFDGRVLRVDGAAATDPAADLAVLKVVTDGEVMPALPIGPDEPPRIGTTVYAIGHPLGLKNVLSEGLVSGLGDPEQGQHFLQTTAAISPGSSGGPLMTADGAVVGVTTATVRDAQNMNFAMPAARVRWLLGQARDAKVMSLARVAQTVGPTGTSEAELDRAVDRVWDALRHDRLRDAARLIEDVGARGGRSAYYWFTCGCVHIRLKNDDLAVEAFRKSLELKPDKLATYLNLGQVYARQGKLKDAIATYESATKLEPNDPRAYAQAGDTFARNEQPQNALPFYRKAVQLDPRNANYQRDLGLACTLSGHPDEAVAPFRKAAELEPAVSDHHRNLGILLVGLKRDTEAVKALQKAVSLKPDSAESYLFLGYAHHGLGNRQAAADAWRNADRFDSRTGTCGQYARQALGQYAKKQEPTIPGRK